MKILTRYHIIGCIALSKRREDSLRPFLIYLLKNTFEISGKKFTFLPRVECEDAAS